jgi:hypothetical protein
MSRPLSIVLSSAERARLEAARAHDDRAYLRERAAFLLKLADGETIPFIAKHGLLTRRQRGTLYGWLAAYRKGGIDALVMLPRGHRGFSPSAGGDGAADRPSRPGDARVSGRAVATG